VLATNTLCVDTVFTAPDEPSFELTETFQGYIALLPPMNRQASMAYPFFYLQSSDIWNLQPRFEASIKPGQTIKAVAPLSPPMNRQASMAYPFFYLQSSDIWNLQPRFEANIKPGQTIKAVTPLSC